MPGPQEKGKSWRFEFGSYKDTGATTVTRTMRMDANDKSPRKGTFGGNTDAEDQNE